jgi:TonB family protein
MSEATLIDQLDEGIEALMARGDPGNCDAAVVELLAIAAELRRLPDPDFKARLKADLLDEVAENTLGAHRLAVEFLTMEGTEEHGGAAAVSPFLPSLFASQYDVYPVRRGSFMASLVAHAAAVAVVVTSGIWAAQGIHEKPRVSSAVVTDISYVLPPATDEAHGGGGGGDRDILQASKGNPPRFTKEQITPPAIVVRSEQPKLPVEATVVGPPNLSFPQTSQMGDPIAGVLGPPSNGPGSSGGMGTGSRGGVGPGAGPGVGDGWGGGIGGSGPYRVGGRVSAPRAVYDPEPEYSEEARKAKYQGVLTLQVVVGADGLPRDVRIARSLGMGLDEKAVEAVRHWRFEPGRMDGRPVPVVVNVEVNFRLY